MTTPSEAAPVGPQAASALSGPDVGTTSDSVNSSSRTATYYLVLTWGVVGVLALLGRALYRLTPIAIEPIADGSLTPALWALYLGWVVFNAYGEGYRAFQKAFCPRVVARADHLAKAPRPLWHALLAPAYCLSLFHANRRGRTVAWCMIGGIALLVVLVSRAPQPYRGIVDGGVVVALAWGCLVLIALYLRALAGHPPANAKMNLPGS